MHLGVDVDRGPSAGAAQVLDLGFQVGDGLFEIQVIRVHLWTADRKGGEFSRSGVVCPYGWVGRPFLLPSGEGGAKRRMRAWVFRLTDSCSGSELSRPHPPYGHLLPVGEGKR